MNNQFILKELNEMRLESSMMLCELMNGLFNVLEEVSAIGGDK